MLLILNALLIIFTIHCLLSLIGIRRVVDYFLAMTLGFTAETFLITEFLSLFHLFAPLPFFIAEILLLSLVVFFGTAKVAHLPSVSLISGVSGTMRRCFSSTIVATGLFSSSSCWQVLSSPPGR